MKLRDVKPALALSQELADSLDLTVRRSLEANLEDLFNEKAARDAYSRDYEKHSAVYRQWLAEHPDDSIEDPEKGFIAYLKARRNADSYDVAAMPVELVLKLAQAHALNIDRAVLDSLRGKSVLPVDADAFRIPGGETQAMYVEKKK